MLCSADGALKRLHGGQPPHGCKAQRGPAWQDHVGGMSMMKATVVTELERMEASQDPNQAEQTRKCEFRLIF